MFRIWRCPSRATLEFFSDIGSNDKFRNKVKKQNLNCIMFRVCNGNGLGFATTCIGLGFSDIGLGFSNDNASGFATRESCNVPHKSLPL